MNLPSSNRFPFSRDDLLANGYVVLPDAIEPKLLGRLQRLSDARLAEQERAHFETFKFHGSMLELDPFRSSDVSRLVRNRCTLNALDHLGFPDPKWLSGYLISKPAPSPSLWWHQDWWAWRDPVSFEPEPPQMFVMYYLRDVTQENGALRVIPGSHKWPHPLHRELPPAHSPEINVETEQGLAHRHQDGEVTVTVPAGGAVIGDARVLHSTHPNRSDHRRTCLTLWYLPRFSQLPEPIQAYVMDHPAQPNGEWWRSESAIADEMRNMLPIYEGSAESADYERTPPLSWPAASRTA